jgi:parallel beta-helix repeat protein
MRVLLALVSLTLVAFLVNAARQPIAPPTTGQGKVIVANNFPGADLGAKINAADKSLGAALGEIQVRGGGVISTQVIINPDHTLRFTAGTYRLETQLQDEGAILLKSRTSVVGSGWNNTIIVEPPKTGWIVFQSFEDIRAQPVHSGKDSDISITNLQIRGANPAIEGGVRQTIGLGNCHRCKVESVWFNGTGVIGVQAGGSGFGGNFADTVTIRGNLFTHVASQAAAVVNGRNVIIDGNTFKGSGRPRGQGMTPIDIEPNHSNDIAQNIQITNNVIDSRDSGFLHGNGILVQNGASTKSFGPVLVKGNKVSGGDLLPSNESNIAVGIYVAGAQDVTVTDNVVQRVSHSGIRLESSRRVTATRNRLISTGTGGIFAFEVLDTSDSRIEDNAVTVDPNSPLGNSVILQKNGARNSFRGNTDGRNPIVPSKP